LFGFNVIWQSLFQNCFLAPNQTSSVHGFHLPLNPQRVLPQHKLKYLVKLWPPLQASVPTTTPWGSLGKLKTTIVNVVHSRLSAVEDVSVILQAKRLAMHDKMDSCHLGITKCTARAAESVWWLNMSYQITEMGKKCKYCENNSTISNLHSPFWVP